MDGLDLTRFSRPVSVACLFQSRCSEIPRVPGLYIVTRSTSDCPAIVVSTGGWFKGRDPSYPHDIVEHNWVPGARVLYVGMTRCKKGLRHRIRQLVDFAHGKAVGHRGGRMLWHLADGPELEVRWFGCDKGDADALESSLIQDFRREYGTRPFANMAK